MKLLCVEDNSTLRKMIDLMLSATGVHVEFAANGREAVEAYEVSEYDAILMDMEMPVMDGLEATKEIRQIEYGHHLSHTPILFLTGNDDRSALVHGQEVGGDGHLMKPFTPEALFKALDRVRHLPSCSGYDGGMAAHA
ncbi:response regulator [Asticcacaulis sp. BYS171W]|uniref:Response regulator n=1 Tax=Asticcacaulis aquaticus TaxID=2984212 RepID=A0ABT5HYU6_9CAUL|nr:response regulator [Asticcacaulis aquaticus]